MKLLAVFFIPEGNRSLPKSVIRVIGEEPTDFLLAHLLNLEGKTKADILHVSVVDTGEGNTIPEFYLPCLTYDASKDKVVFDSAKIIELNFQYWIPQRQEMLKHLDVEFLKALEKSDEKEKRKIVTNKELLRDLPNFVLTKWAETLQVIKSNGDISGSSAPDSRFNNKNGQIYFKGRPIGIVDTFDAFTPSQQKYYMELFNARYTRKEAMFFTPFHNILFVDVLNGGSGYNTPPNITFDCPYPGSMAPRYQCVLNKNSLQEVKIITPGCGFLEEPKITVSDPDSPNGNRAIVAAKIYNKIVQSYPSFSAKEREEMLPKEW